MLIIYSYLSGKYIMHVSTHCVSCERFSDLDSCYKKTFIRILPNIPSAFKYPQISLDLQAIRTLPFIIYTLISTKLETSDLPAN